MAIADARGVDPLELPPLYEEVDLEALDQLFSTTERTDGEHTRFVAQMAGCEVTVRGGPTVDARPLDAPGEGSIAGR